MIYPTFLPFSILKWLFLFRYFFIWTLSTLLTLLQPSNFEFTIYICWYWKKKLRASLKQENRSKLSVKRLKSKQMMECGFFLNFSFAQFVEIWCTDQQQIVNNFSSSSFSIDFHIKQFFLSHPCKWIRFPCMWTNLPSRRIEYKNSFRKEQMWLQQT